MEFLSRFQQFSWSLATSVFRNNLSILVAISTNFKTFRSSSTCMSSASPVLLLVKIMREASVFLARFCQVIIHGNLFHLYLISFVIFIILKNIFNEWKKLRIHLFSSIVANAWEDNFSAVQVFFLKNRSACLLISSLPVANALDCSVHAYFSSAEPILSGIGAVSNFDSFLFLSKRAMLYDDNAIVI